MPDEPYKEFTSQIRYNLNIPKMMGYLNSQRKIVLSGEITDDRIRDVGVMLLQLDYDKTEPITLLIDSNGGSCPAAYYLGDLIRALNSPVDALVLGEACSMAVDVLQMCRKRMMTPNSRLYCHFTRIGFQLISDSDEYCAGDAAVLQKRVLDYKKVREKMYVERSGLELSKIQEIFRQGEMYKLYLTAQEALALNLVDGIVTDFKFFKRQAE